MNKKVMIPVITIPAISIIAAVLYLVKKAKLSRKELEDEMLELETTDINF